MKFTYTSTLSEKAVLELWAKAMVPKGHRAIDRMVLLRLRMGIRTTTNGKTYEYGPRLKRGVDWDYVNSHPRYKASSCLQAVADALREGSSGPVQKKRKKTVVKVKRKS